MGKQDFDDVQELRNGSLGVLGGEGADFLEKTKTETTPQGIDTTCTCGSCGRPNVITVEYGEAITGSENLMPEHWQFDKTSRSIFPDIGCANCRYQLKLLFTPQELKRLVQQAVNDGTLNPGYVNQMVAQLRQQKTQQRR